MILVYYNLETESTYYYLSRFDSNKVVGESNKFGDVLLGLYLVDLVKYKLTPFREGGLAELIYKLDYVPKKDRKEE